MIGELAVVIPAADEEERIAACLNSVRRACARVATLVPIRIVVVLDRCSDRTAEIVSSFREVEAVHTDVRNVGAARALGTEHALARSPDPQSLWVASTDADSIVPVDWLAYQLHAGAELVLGTVTPSAALGPAARSVWQRHHDPADGHRHVHGANLGVRASSLVALGNWAPLATGEDVDLVERATAAGMAIRRTGAIAVRTSARIDGRAPEGFSSYLRTLGHA